METQKSDYEVIIIGGSYAGLAAGMTLGRAIRKTLIIDSGKPWNRQTPHTHNFITHDGATPREVTLEAKRQVLLYPTVRFADDLVTGVEGEDGAFRVMTKKGEVYTCKKLIFATGIHDIMPDIPGFAESWGISVIHCPYCHGYEVRGKRTGMMINGEGVADFVKLILNWTDDLTVYTNGPAEFDTKEVEALGVRVVASSIAAVIHTDGYMEHLEFTDGNTAKMDALYYRAAFEQHCKIPAQMGCAINEGGYIEVNDFQQTNLPGVYAVGDATTFFRAVSVANASGSKAGAIVNHEMIA